MGEDGIVFLATRLTAAQTDIRCDYEIVSFAGQDRGKVIMDGQTRPFRIVTTQDQLHGLRFHDYRVLDHAFGCIDSRMLDLADVYKRRSS